MKKLMFAALAFSAVVASPASAVTVFGSTATGQTYNRPLAGAPPVGLSAVGTAVGYEVTAFTVSTSGSYTLAMTPMAMTPFDTFLGIHNTAFFPLAALTNAIAYDDDGGPGSDSLLTVSLLAGTSYFAIATGFANTDVGRYSLEITGPGVITIGGGGQGAVPEPSTWAMIIAGFGIVGGALRRRRRAGVAFA